MDKNNKNKTYWLIVLFVVILACVFLSLIFNRSSNNEEPVTTTKEETTTEVLEETTEEVTTQEETTISIEVHETISNINIKNFTDKDKNIFGKDYDYVYGYLISEVRAFYPNTEYLEYQGLTNDSEIVKAQGEKVYVFKAIIKGEVDRYFYLHKYSNGEYYIENM